MRKREGHKAGHEGTERENVAGEGQEVKGKLALGRWKSVWDKLVRKL